MKQFKQITLEQMHQVVDYLLPSLTLGTIVFLEGPLGAGKTTLVQLLAKKLKILDHVVSPTYTIAKTYRFNDGELVHIDAYRLAYQDDDQQWIDMCDEKTLCMIEWPTHLKSYQDLRSIKVEIEITSIDTRTITIKVDKDV